MNEHRIQFTATAEQQVQAEREWWLGNRDHQDLFAAELEGALRILTLMPGAGAPYTQASTRDLRRLYLRKLACHLYYTFDDHAVIIRAMWGARRGRGPDL